MVHPKVFQDPMLRERYGIKANRQKNIWLLIGGSILSIIWFIWSGTNIANPEVRTELISFKVIDNQSVSITYKISVKNLNTSHSCDLVARDIDKNVVGELTDNFNTGQLIDGKNLRTVVISTRTPAVNAGISSCQ
jgi:hypothetical protein